MTRLEQALRWWVSPRRDGDLIPARHYDTLCRRDLLGEINDDGEVDLNEDGDAAALQIGYRRHPKCRWQWVRTTDEEGERGDHEGEGGGR